MALILSGRETEAALGPGHEVIDWREHGYNFNNAPSTVPRLNAPDLVMIHWTGGENGIKGLSRTLMARGLGVSFFVDRSGDIYQLLDPMTVDPKDVGGVHGRRTISIEVANYGFVQRGKPPKRGRDRLVDDERVHGMRLKVARFYSAQVKSVRMLCEELCSHLKLPLDLPRERDGGLALRRLRGRELRRFSGVLGHLHKTDRKADPGFLIFHILAAVWHGTGLPERYGEIDLSRY